MSTNQAEGYFSQLKRVPGRHPPPRVGGAPAPVLSEFDFRYTTRNGTDTERMKRLVGRVGGLRLMYRPVTDR